MIYRRNGCILFAPSIKLDERNSLRPIYEAISSSLEGTGVSALFLMPDAANIGIIHYSDLIAQKVFDAMRLGEDHEIDELFMDHSEQKLNQNTKEESKTGPLRISEGPLKLKH
jgi:hypothetical protein